jgi:hypothetical protein
MGKVTYLFVGQYNGCGLPVLIDINNTQQKAVFGKVPNSRHSYPIG